MQPYQGDVVLRDSNVQYLLRRLTSKAHEIFSHWRAMTRDYASEHGFDSWEEPWRLTLPTIALWNTFVQRGMAEELLAEVPDIEKVMDFAYVKYVRHNFGKDAYGNINTLEVETAPFSEVYHAFLTRLAATPEMVHNIALDRPLDLARACGNALCDALRDVACTRVVITNTRTPQQVKARRDEEARGRETAVVVKARAPPAPGPGPGPGPGPALLPVTTGPAAAAPAGPASSSVVDVPARALSIPPLPSLPPSALEEPKLTAALPPMAPKRKPRARTKSPSTTTRGAASTAPPRPRRLGMKQAQAMRLVVPPQAAAIPVPAPSAPVPVPVPVAPLDTTSVASKAWKEEMQSVTGGGVKQADLPPAAPPAGAQCFPVTYAVPSQLVTVTPNDSSSQIHSLGARYQLKTQGVASHASRRSNASSQPRTVRFEPPTAAGAAPALLPPQTPLKPRPPLFAKPAATTKAGGVFGTACALPASDLASGAAGGDDDNDGDNDDDDLGSGLGSSRLFEVSRASADTQSCLARPQRSAPDLWDRIAKTAAR